MKSSQDNRNRILSEYYEILNLFEDFLRKGYRRGFEMSPALNSPEESPGKKEAALKQLNDDISRCTLCRLQSSRTHTVPGEGVMNPLVMVIGEAPGADEDKSGRPFVGKAGQYLDQWLKAIGLSRETNCFIGNIVKCRPPENREPLPDESEACRPYLETQISLIKPKAILSVGRIAAQTLTGIASGIASLRGNTYDYRGIPLIPTYHPSGVLRNK
ncbi:MAG: uracil-DNA glycosylase [Spirochaetota bacterium]